MKKQTRIGVRLNPEERKLLESASREIGLPLSDLIRRSVVALIYHIQRHGGRLMLPVNFDENYKITKK